MDWIKNNIINQFGAPSINENIAANRPPAGQAGRLFIATDTLLLERDNGVSYDTIGGGGGGGAYLPLVAGITNPLTGVLYANSGEVITGGVYSGLNNITVVTNANHYNNYLYTPLVPTVDSDGGGTEIVGVYNRFIFAPQKDNYYQGSDLQANFYAGTLFSVGNAAFTNQTGTLVIGYSAQLLITDSTGTVDFGSYRAFNVDTPVMVGGGIKKVNNYTGLYLADSAASGMFVNGSRYGIYQVGSTDNNIFYGSLEVNNAFYQTNNLVTNVIAGRLNLNNSFVQIGNYANSFDGVVGFSAQSFYTYGNPIFYDGIIVGNNDANHTINLNNITGALNVTMYSTADAGTTFGITNNSLASILTSITGVSALAIGTQNAIPLIFGVDNIERARFEFSTGNFLVGSNTDNATGAVMQVTGGLTVTPSFNQLSPFDPNSFAGSLAVNNTLTVNGNESLIGRATATAANSTSYALLVASTFSPNATISPTGLTNAALATQFIFDLSTNNYTVNDANKTESISAVTIYQGVNTLSGITSPFRSYAYLNGSINVVDLAMMQTGLPKKTGTYSGTVTNSYGIYINDISTSDLVAQITNRYGVYQAGATDINFFNGEIICGLGQQVSAHIAAIAGSVKLKINGTYYYLAHMVAPV